MPVRVRDEEDFGLCGTCENGHVRRGDRYWDVQIQCGEASRLPVRRLVRSCSAYVQRNALEKYELEQMAWVLEVKRGKPIGFRPPGKDRAIPMSEDIERRLDEALRE